MVTIYYTLLPGTKAIGTKQKKKINCADGLAGSCVHINNVTGFQWSDVTNADMNI